MRSFSTSALRRGLLLLLLPLAMAGAARADEVTDWHEHMLVALGKANVNAIVSSRDAALVSAAVFDAVNGIERRYEPILVTAAAPRGASKRAAAVQAAYVVLLSRFQAQETDLKAKRAASLAAIGDPATEVSVQRGLAWGQTVANAILAWRSTDGFTPPPAPFLGSDEPGQWRPTSFTGDPPAPVPGAAPQFATMTPWGIRAPSQFRPLLSGPPELDSAQYLLELNETRLKGSAVGADRTEDQTAACTFWGTASGTYVWNLAAIDLGAERDFELSENARLLATLNLAIADAVISCWDAKYYYNFWRPVTAIRLDATSPDPAWTPLLVTPSFPEYTSGHSSIAGAAGTVLVHYFGEDTPFSLESPVVAGLTRSYPNVSTAQAEVADARVFAGIHFRAACVDGQMVGSEVAAHILANSMQRIHGKGRITRARLVLQHVGHVFNVPLGLRRVSSMQIHRKPQAKNRFPRS